MIIREESREHDKIALHIYDCNGHSRFGPMMEQLYPDTQIAIIFFDTTNEVSFKQVSHFRKQLNRACPQASLILVATKSDLVAQAKVFPDDFKKSAREWGIPLFITSAKSKDGCEQFVAALLEKAKETAI